MVSIVASASTVDAVSVSQFSQCNNTVIIAADTVHVSNMECAVSTSRDGDNAYINR